MASEEPPRTIVARARCGGGPTTESYYYNVEVSKALARVEIRLTLDFPKKGAPIHIEMRPHEAQKFLTDLALALERLSAREIEEAEKRRRLQISN